MASTVLTTALELGVEGGKNFVYVPIKIKKVSVKKDVEIGRASAAGNPIGRMEVDKVTGEVVEPDTIRKGMFDGDDFKEIPADALEAITEQTKLDTLRVSHFIPLKDLPVERINDAYFIAANGTARPLRLLYEALVKTRRAGIGKLVFRSRQQPFAVFPAHGGLFLTTLTFSADMRQAQEAETALEGTTATKDEVAAVAELVESLAADVETLDSFEDDLIPLKAELVERALAGQTLVRKKAEKKKVEAHDGLMDSLRESVAEAQKSKSKVAA